ncbi:cupin [Ahniella affigens]|uniref:Cupin n=2 Tax=Ahniella affigens TaxID=2021234 RepID=A0A2P1PZ69_9GAMM|nr:cupin [Ahniella affigens]
MNDSTKQHTDDVVAVFAEAVPNRTRPSVYPAPIGNRFEGRAKKVLGDVFGIQKFGVNLTRLAPGAYSSLRHAHSMEEEFVYILSGQPTLRTNRGDTQLRPGMCAGFRAGNGDAHQLINLSDQDVVFLEIGDRVEGDTVSYPDDDLAARKIDGQWLFFHKDGSAY